MNLGPLHVVKQSGKVCTGSVILLHGSGDTGQGFLNWIKFFMGPNFSLPHIKLYFPTAPLRPYTPLQGELSNVWFDRYNVSPDVVDHAETLEEIGKEMAEFVQNISRSDGLNLDRIIIGGFSMGGSLALQEAYRFCPGLAGVCTMSSFLNNNTLLYKEVEAPDTPLCMFHGDRDTLAPISWGQKTYNELVKMGVTGDFHIVKNAMHELKQTELKELFNWIQKILPPLDT